MGGASVALLARRRSVGVEVKVHHLAVLVADLARAEQFYGGVLGLRVLVRHGERSIWFALDGDAFLAVELTSEPIDPRGGWHCVALGITPSEREAWRAKLAAAGHPVEKETAYTIYCRDPWGTIVALSHYPLL
jgi:catechol 2,3-dioxygenase-like lactoylglutathione lyase family enzyme